MGANKNLFMDEREREQLSFAESLEFQERSENERIFYIRCYYDVDREVISVGALTSFSNLINEVKNYQP